MGAVGGTLGMFLGLSFWQLGKDDVVSRVSRETGGGGGREHERGRGRRARGDSERVGAISWGAIES